MLRDSTVVVAAAVRTRPRAIPLSIITILWGSTWRPFGPPELRYHICMIKPRLHDLALGGVWQPCSTELALIHTTNHVAMKKELYGFLFLRMHVVVSIVMGL